MAELRFWLLDINYEVVDGEPEVWLWGITEDDRRVLVIDRGFHGYFYAVPEENYSPEDVITEINGVRDKLGEVVGLEAAERRFFGRPVRVVRVVCRNPDVLEKYAGVISRLKSVKMCLEHDIRYSMQYLVDRGVRPCGWHEVDVEEAEKPGVQVDGVYVARAPPRAVEGPGTPSLRTLAFSIVCYSERGSPRPERNPVAIISTLTNTGESRQFVLEDGDDGPIIREFVEYIQKFDPDVVVGYGCNKRDWPYLMERAKRHGITLAVSRTGAEPHTSVYGHISITGRANVDLLDYAEDLAEVKVKTLENLADYLGVMKLDERTIIDEPDIPEHWTDPEKRKKLLRFSMENAECIMGIANLSLDFGVQLSNLVGLPLDHVWAAAVGFRVEWYLIREAHERGELTPERARRWGGSYAGGIVLKPKPGIHEDIAVLDFKSMYPNIMVKYNISPDTYIPPEEPEPPEGVYVAPEVNHRFRREPPGFYSEVLTHLLEVREEIRRRLREVEEGSPEYRVLDARQKAVKVVTNATYGYAGWLGARWYLKPVAEAVTAWGRHTISETIKLAEEMGIELVYGDTDSVFVKYEPEKVEKFLKKVKEKLGLEIRPEETYKRVLFTEAKKRYCGLLPDGRLDIVGLEVVRGDWPAVARRVQREVLEIVLKERDVKKARRDAVKLVREYVSKVRRGEVPLRDLVIWKELTMPIEKYKVRTAHVEAAKRMMAEGWELSVGDKVGYVIVTGPGRLHERAVPYFMASVKELDLDYYVRKQVIPAAMRVLSVLGVKEEEVSKPGGTLLGYME